MSQPGADNSGDALLNPDTIREQSNPDISGTGRTPPSDTTHDIGHVLGQDMGKSSHQAGRNLASMSPRDVCLQLVSIGSADPVSKDQLGAFVLGDPTRLSAELKKPQVKNQVASAQCVSQTVAGNHAFVLVETGGMQRLLPFVNVDGGWKLDLAAYRALYRMDRRAPAAQK